MCCVKVHNCVINHIVVFCMCCLKAYNCVINHIIVFCMCCVKVYNCVINHIIVNSILLCYFLLFYLYCRLLDVMLVKATRRSRQRLLSLHQSRWLDAMLSTLREGQDSGS